MHVPRAFPKYCTPGVLTMEYVDGVKPSSRRHLQEAGLDGDVVAERAARFVLSQVFDDSPFLAFQPQFEEVLHHAGRVADSG